MKGWGQPKNLKISHQICDTRESHKKELIRHVSRLVRPQQKEYARKFKTVLQNCRIAKCFIYYSIEDLRGVKFNFGCGLSCFADLHIGPHRGRGPPGGREGGGGTSFTPSKDFKKMYHKNALKVKHENRGPPPRFLITPSTPLKRILK
jgi:hypothetical protein